jgi:hypothetical protein
MKLYTEEQVKAMLINTDNFTPLQIDHFMNEITPIELPSDEEIVDKAFEVKYTNTLFSDGAKWMRDKIQGDNK